MCIRDRIIAENGDQAAVDPEDGHEHKGLDLKIDPQHKDGGVRPAGEQLIEAKGHKAGQGPVSYTHLLRSQEKQKGQAVHGEKSPAACPLC